MKRDMGLIRLLLLRLEGKVVVNLEEYNNEQVLYHKQLLRDAGLAKGNALRGANKLQDVTLTELTWAGHDFLDAIKNDNVWKKTVQRLGKIGGDTAIAVVKSLAVAVAKENLGI